MDPNQLANDFLTWNSLKLSPYDPQKNKPQDLGLGGPSTEFLATIDDPKGGYRNIPTIWYNNQGKAQLVNQDIAAGLADLTQRVTGRSFPNYKDVPTAVKSAEQRSQQGGAERLSILDYADQIRRYK